MNYRTFYNQIESDPASVWEALTEQFGKNTAANIGRLRKEFAATKIRQLKEYGHSSWTIV